ncbi:hypothetical protein BV20DRAFT_1057461 [Pilatotrama ljubarskyi]|nr:hypothetical protein BV20DRAFT_1057461 [Pilatotrama ljubarskyi]
MLLTLPTELLQTVIGALASERDVRDLRTLALVCRALVPVARQELFKVVHVCAIYQPYMRPYLQHVVELRISEPLSAIRFIGLEPAFYREMPKQFLEALASISSITALTLSHALFRHPLLPRVLISAFPNLSGLSVAGLEVVPTHSASSLPDYLFTTKLGHPRLSRLSMTPSNWGSSSTELARWLSSGPSGESLTELVIPPKVGMPHAGILSSFGPSVKDLRMPLRELDGDIYTGYLERYTRVRSLTLFLEAYGTSQGPWFLLAPFFAHGIPSEQLESITLDVRIDYPMTLASAIDWATLDRVNDELDEDRFRALRKVVFVVQWKEELEWCPGRAERDRVERNVEERLHYLARAGRLETRVQMVKEFPDTVVAKKSTAFPHLRDMLTRST